MSLEAFLAEGKAHEQSQSSGGFAIVAKVQVRWAYRSGIGPTSKFFPYQHGDSKAKALAESQCQAEIGGEKWANGKPKRPVFGLLTEVYGDDVPTSDDGKRWQTMPNQVWPDFIEAYANDKVFANMAENLSDEIKNSVKGSMPYTAITEALLRINVPTELFDKPVWGKLSQEVNWWEQLKVIQGKREARTYQEKEVPYRYLLIQHVYANEKEAKTDAEAIKAGQATVQPSDNGQLSAKAVENGWTLEALQGKKTEIENALQNALKGIGSAAMSPPDARKHVAEGYVIALSDLDLLKVDEPAF